MRIDRRGNPGYRKIPAFGDTDGNLGEAGIRQPEQTPADGVGSGREQRDDKLPSAPSDAFSDLESKKIGFFNNIATIFDAVGRALKDIKQGNSKTFD